VFCSPTYLGGPTAEFVAFAEWSSTLRESATLSGKLAAGITCGLAAEGGKTGTLQYMLTLALQHAMLWVGLPSAANITEYAGERVIANAEGYRLGVGATLRPDGLPAGALATAHQLGARVGALCRGWEC
jgi:NAD(P)H dehydrogenase (quinone)